MLSKRSLMIIVVALSMVAGTVFGATLEENWGDFLHYTAVGKFDLAKGYGEKLLQSDPDPVEMLDLSEKYENSYAILLQIYNFNDELKDIASQVITIIEEGRYVKRIDPSIIREEIARLSSTLRGRLKAEERLKNAGEYAVPFFVETLSDPDRENEFPNISTAMSKMDRNAIRPLVASFQMDNQTVKAEVIRALGKIGYPQSAPYLKYIIENDNSDFLKNLAVKSLEQIDPSTIEVSSAKLFFQLAEKYYYHNESISPDKEYDFANMWFWDAEQSKLSREQVSKEYFNELMAMRCCEWALKADPSTSEAISLWISAFFKAEKTGIEQPLYFGQGHADAMTYASTSGPEYLHSALARALGDEDAYIALGLIEALATNAGEKSLLYRYGTDQPLVSALEFNDTAVKYSAAIALGSAGPKSEFTGSKLIIKNLASAIIEISRDELGDDLTEEYSLRAIKVMLKLAVTRNSLVNVSDARTELISVTQNSSDEMKTLAAKVLAYLPSPDAQRAIAQLALTQDVSFDVRLQAFASLSMSAKINGQLLTEEQIDNIYNLAADMEEDVDIRSGAAGAYGSLNLPSQRVKELILDQSKS